MCRSEYWIDYRIANLKINEKDMVKFPMYNEVTPKLSFIDKFKKLFFNR